MKKRILTTIIGAVLLASLSNLACGAMIELTTSSLSVAQGTQVSLDVNISGVTDLYGWQFDLGFTPGVLSAATLTEGPFLASRGATFFISGTLDNAAGSIMGNADSLLSAVPGVTGNGTLATVDFTTQAAGIGTFTLSNVQLLDSNLNPIAASISNGTVTVTPATVPLPDTLGLLVLGLVTVLGLHGPKVWHWQQTARG